MVVLDDLGVALGGGTLEGDACDCSANSLVLLRGGALLLGKLLANKLQEAAVSVGNDEILDFDVGVVSAIELLDFVDVVFQAEKPGELVGASQEAASEEADGVFGGFEFP